MTDEMASPLQGAQSVPADSLRNHQELYSVNNADSVYDAASLCANANQAKSDKACDANGSDATQRGVFITFEGGEGAGKTTHISILAETLESFGREVVRLREPGGTSIGEKLRALVLDPDNRTMCDECELLVYEAARAQVVHEVIAPALERGAVVLCDRFYDSTVAYQGGGRGMDASFIERANAFACQGIHPDRTILLVPPSAKDGLKRAVQFGQADRLEQEGDCFHERVRDAFAALADDNPQRIRTVESASAVSDTARIVFGELLDLFPCFGDLLCDETFFARFDSRSDRAEKVVFGGSCASSSAKGVR